MTQEARFEETLRRAHLLNDAQMAARASNNLGSLVHLQGKDALAVNLYCSALHVYRMQGDRLGTAQTCHNLALAYRLEGRFAEALDANHQAVEAAEQAGDQALLALTRMGRAETWLEWGEPDEGRDRAAGCPGTRRDLWRRGRCWRGGTTAGPRCDAAATVRPRHAARPQGTEDRGTAAVH
jgi:tetratricopeptide (TPR) repeat protein